MERSTRMDKEFKCFIISLSDFPDLLLNIRFQAPGEIDLEAVTAMHVW